MAGPVYKANGGRVTGTAVTTITATKPAVTAGTAGVQVAVVSSLNNATHSSVTAGWTKVRQDNNGANRTASLWVAPQTAAALVVTWTGAVNASAFASYFADDLGSPLDATTLGATAVGTGTNANPVAVASITSTRDGSAFYYVVINGNTNIGTPAGYTEHYDISGSGGSFAAGSKTSVTSGTASGAISVNASIAANLGDFVVYHVEVLREIGSSPSLQSSQVEVGAWVEPDGFSASVVEVGAWLDPSPSAPVSFHHVVRETMVSEALYVPPAGGRRRQIICT